MGATEDRLIRAYIEGFNRRDTIDPASFFAEDAVCEEFALGSVVRGLEGVEMVLRSMAQTDLWIDIIDCSARRSTPVWNGR